MDKIWWQVKIQPNNSNIIITKEVWTLGDFEIKAKEKAVGEVKPIGKVIEIRKIKTEPNIDIGNPLGD